jgi:hypothetical protein
MPIASRTRWIVALAALLPILAHATMARAADQPNEERRVRPAMPGGQQLLAEDMNRSATVRALVERLEGSDLVVYVQMRFFIPHSARGRLIFVSAAAGRRYVVVEVACGESWNTQLSTLGHELRHAVEIADAAWVHSPADMAAFYAGAGMQIDFEAGHEAFETLAAQDAGRRVARELADGSSRIAAR